MNQLINSIITRANLQLVYKIVTACNYVIIIGQTNIVNFCLFR